MLAVLSAWQGCRPAKLRRLPRRWSRALRRAPRRPPLLQGAPVREFHCQTRRILKRRPTTNDGASRVTRLARNFAVPSNGRPSGAIPDKHHGREEPATAVFLHVTEAYDTLRSPTGRANYDENMEVCASPSRKKQDVEVQQDKMTEEERDATVYNGWKEANKKHLQGRTEQETKNLHEKQKKENRQKHRASARKAPRQNQRARCNITPKASDEDKENSSPCRHDRAWTRSQSNRRNGTPQASNEEKENSTPCHHNRAWSRSRKWHGRHINRHLNISGTPPGRT